MMEDSRIRLDWLSKKQMSPIPWDQCKHIMIVIEVESLSKSSNQHEKALDVRANGHIDEGSKICDLKLK
jgi:hypothetical protein